MIEAVSGQKPQRARLVRAANPGPLTLDGTNTWVLADHDSARCVIVDPGPDDSAHCEAVLTSLTEWGLRTALIVVTHGHDDHTGSVDALWAATGAPVRAISRQWCRDAVPLVDQENIEIDGLSLHILATPGHTSDSLSILLPVDGALVTGDTVLGRGSALVAWPDGQLGRYLQSLQRLRTTAAAGLALTLLPGHGPQVPNALQAIDALLTHRQQRLDQVRAVLADDASSVDDVASRVYGAVDPGLRAAVHGQVNAQLEYLAARGELRAAAALNTNRS